MHISTHITNEKKWHSYRRKIVNEGNSSMKGRTVSEIGCSAPICNFGVLTGEYERMSSYSTILPELPDYILGYSLSFSSCLSLYPSNEEIKKEISQVH